MRIAGLKNVILQFESKRLRTAFAPHAYWYWGYAALFILTMMAAAALFLFPHVPFIAPNEVSFIAGIAIIIQTVLNLILLQRALGRATTLTRRERVSRANWETFVLTGVEDRVLIMGKWTAVLRSLWQEFFLMGSIRALMFPVAFILRLLHVDYPYLPPNTYSLANYMPELPKLLIVMASVFVLTLAQLPMMAAIGVLAASRRSAQATGFGQAVAIWLLMSQGMAVIIAVAFIFYNQSVFSTSGIAAQAFHGWLVVKPAIVDVTVLVGAAVVDTSVLSPLAIISSTFAPEAPYWWSALPAGLIVGVYGLWTASALWFSIRLSRWQGLVRMGSL